MSLILAIEPDRRQTTKLGRLAEQLQLDLVIGESADAALAALGARVPDLVLTSQLLVPKDEAALAERLREFGAAGAHVQTLVIPVLRGDDSTGKKKGGRGLFGRLRGDSRDDETSQDGCDPAVFATEINDYLERGAAERAALAAAQADLEAAWADQPAPTVDVTPAPPPSYAELDVHPDMVIEDPEALFGEFAAIPIRRAAPEETAVTPRRPDEEWEEIPLDIDAPGHTSGRPPAAADAPPPVPHGVELTSEPVDLDAFVRDLHTVQSSANAQPMIPVVDLTDVFAGDIALPEPTVVNERELLEDERATFEAEVTAVFGASAFAAAIDTIEPPLSATADVTAELLPDATPAAASVQWPDFVAPQPMPTPTWVERPQTDWSAAIDALPPPPSVAPSVETETAPAPAPAQLEPGWQDMLSAIRRDIKSLKTDEVAPAPAKPKLEFNAEPLVFPSRPAVAASVLSEFDAQVAQRTREADERARQAGLLAHEAEQLAREAQDRTRAAEEALRAAAATVVASQIVEASTPLPIDSAPSIFDARIDADLMAVAFEPIVTLPPAAAQSPGDAFGPFGPFTADIGIPTAAVEPDLAPAAHGAPAAPAASDALDWLLNAPPQPAAVEPAVPLEVIAEVEPEPPAPTAEARPVVTTPFVTTPVSNTNRQKPGKNKKKRRHEPPPPPSPAYVPVAVYAPIPEWGFFDLQRAEFGPLLARLSHDANDLRALPRR